MTKTPADYFADIASWLGSPDPEEAIAEINHNPDSFDLGALLIALTTTLGDRVPFVPNIIARMLHLLETELTKPIPDSELLVRTTLLRLVEVIELDPEKSELVYSRLNARAFRKLSLRGRASTQHMLAIAILQNGFDEGVLLAHRSFLIASRLYAKCRPRTADKLRLAQDSCTQAAKLLAVAVESGAIAATALRSQIVKTKRQAKRLQKGLAESEQSLELLTYYGFLWLFDPRWPKFFRLSHSVLTWKRAFRRAWDEENHHCLLEISKMVERFQLVLVDNPVASELKQASSNHLDDRYYYELWNSIVDGHLLCCHIYLDEECRRNFIEKYIVEYDCEKACEVSFEWYLYSMAKATILEGWFERRSHDKNMANEYTKLAQNILPKMMSAAQEAIGKSQAIEILKDYLNGKAEFCLYLRPHSVENHLIFTSRPRSFYFEGNVVEDYAAFTLARVVTRGEPVRQIVAALSALPTVSLANVWDLYSNSPENLINPIVSSVEQWRDLAFSLIGEAAAVVVTLPSDYRHDRYTGLVEELAFIKLLGRPDKIVCVRVDGEPTEAMERFKKAAMILTNADEMVAQGTILGGESAEGPYPKEWVEELFHVSELAIPASWASLVMDWNTASRAALHQHLLKLLHPSID